MNPKQKSLEEIITDWETNTKYLVEHAKIAEKYKAIQTKAYWEKRAAFARAQALMFGAWLTYNNK